VDRGSVESGSSLATVSTDGSDLILMGTADQPALHEFHAPLGDFDGAELLDASGFGSLAHSGAHGAAGRSASAAAHDYDEITADVGLRLDYMDVMKSWGSGSFGHGVGLHLVEDAVSLDPFASHAAHGPHMSQGMLAPGGAIPHPASLGMVTGHGVLGKQGDGVVPDMFSQQQVEMAHQVKAYKGAHVVNVPQRKAAAKSRSRARATPADGGRKARGRAARGAVGRVTKPAAKPAKAVIDTPATAATVAATAARAAQQMANGAAVMPPTGKAPRAGLMGGFPHSNAAANKGLTGPPPKPLSSSDDDSGDNLTRAERVMRYLRKKKNRTFNTKIRYEIRKLNAERRPRIKGRFVKREELAAMVAAGLVAA
jgi:hypothetical protein